MKHPSLLILFLLLSILKVNGQFVFRANKLPEQTSIIKYSSIADAGNRELSIKDVVGNQSDLLFRPVKGLTGNLGFTDHTYWLKFDLHNASDLPVYYYLETAEPVTDNVRLYLLGQDNKYKVQESGDNLSFDKRIVDFRKTVFKLQLHPGEKKQAVMEVRNDGEKNNLPLTLISQERFLEIVYHDQLMMGVFYGILLIITITYLFFYFAINERIFLFYTLYVAFVALCQFALDGFFHQYIDRSNSWVNLHAVIISAIGGAYFFGKYSELVLNVKKNDRKIYIAFKFLYILLGVTLALIVFVPAFLPYSYPAVNVLTLIGMLLIAIAIITLIIRKQGVDLFYTTGIAILFICFTLAIMMNFGLITAFTIDNITKPAIGLEVIMLSLSMANRIRLLKSKKEELQALALKKSEEMNEVKSYFLSNMSHELRTPLNAILGLTSAMERETANSGILANCAEINNAAFNLISSVNDIMDFSMIEKGEIRLEKVKFSPFEILEKVKLNHQGQALIKGLEFNYSTNLPPALQVLGDPARLQQMVNNILSNAIKFTSSGSVSIKVEGQQNSAGELDLLVSISDTGIGISPEKLSSVFEMFSQVDISNKRKYGGFGIGLCVVNALVTLHGGKIELISRQHEGTSCSLAIPYELAPAEVKFINKFPSDSYDLMGKHVLVVEDNPMNQMVMKMMMKKWLNTTVSFSDNGAASLEALKNNPIDLVLMDLQMPVMDGYEATEAIRKGKAGLENDSVPIIVLTADVMETTRTRIMELGADDFMTKPVDQKLLYQKITALLS
ncbi:response regulator [Flavihumibacter sp. R14]|nr:response regulator [Flavihumibacter soli]